MNEPKWVKPTLPIYLAEENLCCADEPVNERTDGWMGNNMSWVLLFVPPQSAQSSDGRAESKMGLPLASSWGARNGLANRKGFLSYLVILGIGGGVVVAANIAVLLCLPAVLRLGAGGGGGAGLHLALLVVVIVVVSVAAAAATAAVRPRSPPAPRRPPRGVVLRGRRFGRRRRHRDRRFLVKVVGVFAAAGATNGGGRRGSRRSARGGGAAPR